MLLLKINVKRIKAVYNSAFEACFKPKMTFGKWLCKMLETLAHMFLTYFQKLYGVV